MTDTRRLLAECADLFVMCDDQTKIPCSRFHVSTRCQVLKWVVEDTNTKTVPFPNIPSKNLKCALDIVHGLATLEDYLLEDVDAASAGFDVLGCDIDTTVRIWTLVKSMDIEDIRPRLPRLMRSKFVDRDTVLQRVITLAPLFDDVLATIDSIEPDAELGTYLACSLRRLYPVAALVTHIAAIIPGLTLEQALDITGCNGGGTYIHPIETKYIMAYLCDTFSSQPGPAVNFLRSMYTAMQTYDVAPLSCAAMSGSIIMYHDLRATSTMLVLNGTPPRRRVVLSKWLKFSLEDRAVAVVWAHGIDHAAKMAKCLDVRIFVQTRTQRAELWHSWNSPMWIPSMDVSTDACPRITGDRQAFDAVVEAGKFARKMTIRVDMFYGKTSALEYPPLFSHEKPCRCKV